MDWTKRRIWLSAAAVLLMLVSAAIAKVVYGRLQERSERLEFIAQQTFVVVVGDSSKCAVSSARSGREELNLPSTAIEIAKIAVDRGTALSAEYLAAAAQDTSSQLKLVQQPIYLYSNINADRAMQIPTGLECLIIANGHLGLIDTSIMPPALKDVPRQQALDPEKVFAESNQDGQGSFALRNLHFDDYPLSYFEFRLIADPAGQFFKLIPAVIYFRDSITSVKPEDAKQVEITLTARTPTSTGLPMADGSRDNLLFQTSITLVNLRAGGVYGVLDTDGTNQFTAQSEWFPILNLPNAEEMDKLRAKTNGRASPFGVANLKITYRESEKPDLLLQYVGRALSDHSNSGK